MQSPISNRQLGTWLITAIAMLIAAATLPQLQKPQVQITGAVQPGNLSIAGLTPTDIELTPNSGYEPGITILSRVNDNGDVDEIDPIAVSTAPIAAGADAANGYGISLGEAQAFSSLSTRFARIAKMNAALFRELEPRAIFVETPSGLSARLIAGPFATRNEASKTCAIVLLPNNITCKSQAFDGDLIARQ